MGRVVTYVVVIFISMAVFGAIGDIVVGLATGSSEAGVMAGAIGGGIGLIGAILGLNSYYARKNTDAPATPAIVPSPAAPTVAGTPPSSRLDEVLSGPSAAAGRDQSNTPPSGKEAASPEKAAPESRSAPDSAHADLRAMIDKRTRPE